MLIIKDISIKATDIVSFRLNSGENLVAKIVEFDETKDFFIVTKPIVANPINNGDGFGLYFSPFAPAIDEEMNFQIAKANLMFRPLPPRDEIKASYIKMTTGLEIA